MRWRTRRRKNQLDVGAFESFAKTLEAHHAPVSRDSLFTKTSQLDDQDLLDGGQYGGTEGVGYAALQRASVQSSVPTDGGLACAAQHHPFMPFTRLIGPDSSYTSSSTDSDTPLNTRSFDIREDVPRPDMMSTLPRGIANSLDVTSQSDFTHNLLDGMSPVRSYNESNMSSAQTALPPKHWKEQEDANEQIDALWEKIHAIELHLQSLQSSRTEDTSQMQAEVRRLRDHIIHLEAQSQTSRELPSDDRDPPPQY